ncbi:FAD:protein FMN transferase [Streptomyces sp. NPDC050560]|uniref:FAD:protein FMN transferase n=1 Tax=Streptomyces sp. NPDC050560 TaxID=3365630 RepID=UPI0037B1E5C4
MRPQALPQVSGDPVAVPDRPDPSGPDRPHITEPTPVRPVNRHHCTVFTCEVTLACCGEPETPFPVVERWLRDLERRFSRFRQDSEISRLNRSRGRWCEISPEMYLLLAHALNAAVLSEGLVNIAVLPRLLAAGYVGSWPFPLPTGGPLPVLPPEEPVLPLTTVLELTRTRARLLPGQTLDIGALAKGVWADDAIHRLGPDSAAELGGDVSCRGPGPTGEGWPIALPDAEVLLVRDGAVATSGTAKRRWGTGLHHLIDPRTGRPSRSDIARATVVATSGSCAEWVSTALVVGGSPVIGRLADRGDVRGLRLTRTEESDG